jgi:hypothetical protein
MPDRWFAQLIDDCDDPSTPLFYETMAYASRQGWDLMAPEDTLGAPGIGVQVLELRRQVALKTPTMAMPVVE